MTRKKTSAPRKGAAGRSLTPIDVPANYNFGPAKVDGVSVYHVNDRHPRGDGPWADEADKTAWWDENTGLACIIRRSKSGSLSGFVAVPRGHDLFGFDHVAIRPLGVVQMAAQLKALGDGDEMPAIAFPPPPVGLDRKEGR